MSGNDTSQPIWPPSNFELWPLTRIAALVVNGILTLAFIWFLVIIPIAHFGNQKRKLSTVMISDSYARRWGLIVYGKDVIRLIENQFTFDGYRICCFCLQKAQFEYKDILSVEAVRNPLWPYGLIWAFFSSCLCGIWLHFWPCIWWTCDWGYYDGQGVRGGIWFGSWALLFILMCFRTRTAILLIKYQYHSESPVCEQYIHIKGGNCYDTENEEIKTLINKINAFRDHWRDVDNNKEHPSLRDS
ncbi:unnamed protein product [Owenia fusiformis]|uniref:Uncharacterized protein n=1 Tax=Owenia fusiformis TaxID=6347 RepID=A0A8J1XXG2_OWEFU|nr:unnamed protein product [Owenia fusiformis]